MPCVSSGSTGWLFGIMDGTRARRRRVSEQSACVTNINCAINTPSMRGPPAAHRQARARPRPAANPCPPPPAQFADVTGGCERILRTPVPLMYTRHNSRWVAARCQTALGLPWAGGGPPACLPVAGPPTLSPRRRRRCAPRGRLAVCLATWPTCVSSPSPHPPPPAAPRQLPHDLALPAALHAVGHLPLGHHPRHRARRLPAAGCARKGGRFHCGGVGEGGAPRRIPAAGCARAGGAPCRAAGASTEAGWGRVAALLSFRLPGEPGGSACTLPAPCPVRPLPAARAPVLLRGGRALYLFPSRCWPAHPPT